MRPSVKLSFLAVIICFAACTKSHVSTKNTSAGQWNLVSDTAFVGVGYDNHLVGYTGQQGDYFTFSTNGNVYTKEGTVLDTLTYKMVSPNGIIISDFGVILNGVPETSTITGLGAGSLTASNGGEAQTIVIQCTPIYTPGGAFWRKVTLSR